QRADDVCDRGERDGHQESRREHVRGPEHRSNLRALDVDFGQAPPAARPRRRGSEHDSRMHRWAPTLWRPSMLLEDTSHRLNCVYYRRPTNISSIMVVVFVIFIFVDIMLIDGDTPVVASANQLAHGLAPGPGCGVDVCAGVSLRLWSGVWSGEALGNEDPVALGVGGHR